MTPGSMDERKYLVFKEFQLIDSHPVAYAQPGKHAFFSGKDCFNSNLVIYLMTIIPCRFLTGRGGLLQKGFEKSLKEEDKNLVKKLFKKRMKVILFLGRI